MIVNCVFSEMIAKTDQMMIVNYVFSEVVSKRMQRMTVMYSVKWYPK